MARSTCSKCTRPTHARGLCKRHYGLEHNRGVFDSDLALPTSPNGIITPQMLGITATEIAERCADADLALAESAVDALTLGYYWREAHPEQFAPAAVAALYPDPAGLAFSAWADDAARRAA